MAFDINSKEIDNLVREASESTRQDTQSPRRYIDYDGNYSKISERRHTVVFGRRGSGKTTLLRELHQKDATRECIFVDAEQYKKLTFPDTLLQIFRAIVIELKARLRRRTPHALNLIKRRLRRRLIELSNKLGRYDREFADLLGRFDEAEVMTTEASSSKDSREAGLEAGKSAKVRAAVGHERTQSDTKTATGVEHKLSMLDRKFQDFKILVDAVWKHLDIPAFVILDDFYHLRMEDQANVVDYLARLVKNTGCYLKIGTISHRSRIYKSGNTIAGLQLGHDAADINLDKTFKSFQSVQQFMGTFWKSICSSVGIQHEELSIFAGDSWNQLVLASGGVPRDLMNIFTKSVDVCRYKFKRTTRLEKRIINEAASLYLRDSKRQDLYSDSLGDTTFLERLLKDISDFCTNNRKKNVFLIDTRILDSNPRLTEALRQLCDFRFVHEVHENTSQKSTPGRFKAYLLDVGLYAHPERRKDNRVTEIAFWEKGARDTADELRSAPVYVPNDNYGRVKGDVFADPEESSEDDIQTSHPESKIPGPSKPKDPQGELFE